MNKEQAINILLEHAIRSTDSNDDAYAVERDSLTAAILFLENEIKKLRASIPICFLNIYDDPDLFDFSPAKVGILQTVYHPYLGEGNITDYENNSQGPTVYVKFLNSGFKKLLVSHEKLKTKQHGEKSII